jgi:hypothetical protein
MKDYEQHPLGSDPTSLDGMNQASSADRAVRGECRSCASHQGGTNFDNDLDQLKTDAPGQLEAEDLVDPNYCESMYHTDGEWQQRQWKDSDNTGGEGVSPPDMPMYIQPKRSPKKPY